MSNGQCSVGVMSVATETANRKLFINFFVRMHFPQSDDWDESNVEDELTAALMDNGKNGIDASCGKRVRGPPSEPSGKTVKYLLPPPQVLRSD